MDGFEKLRSAYADYLGRVATDYAKTKMPAQERDQIVLLKLWKISAKPNGLATAKNVRRYLAQAVVNSLRDEFRAREGRHRNRPKQIPLSMFDERAVQPDGDGEGVGGPSRSLEIDDPAAARRAAREDLERAIPRIKRMDGRFRISRRLRDLRKAGPWRA